MDEKLKSESMQKESSLVSMFMFYFESNQGRQA